MSPSPGSFKNSNSLISWYFKSKFKMAICSLCYLEGTKPVLYWEISKPECYFSNTLILLPFSWFGFPQGYQATYDSILDACFIHLVPDFRTPETFRYNPGPLFRNEASQWFILCISTSESKYVSKPHSFFFYLQILIESLYQIRISMYFSSKNLRFFLRITVNEH